MGQASAALWLAGCAAPPLARPTPTPPPPPDDLPPSSLRMRPRLDDRPLSLSFKIGQMLLLGFTGARVDERSDIVRDIHEYGVGGVVLFRHNIGWPSQVQDLTATLQDASFQATGLPLLIAADQEGGRVSRLNSQFGLLQNYSAQDLGALDDLEKTRSYATGVAQSLKGVGINLNLAPVVDLNVNPRNPVIGALARSFSADPEVVTRHAAAFIEAHADEGLLCTLKHFPGHGSSRQDSHYGFVDVTHSWTRDELNPYRNLISSGRCDAVMTAHIFNAALDPQLPATLSPAVLTDLLRVEMGYDGLIFTDDLQMDAIRAYYRFEEAVRLAILAGVDVLSISKTFIFQKDAAAVAIDTILNMVETGEIDEARIDRSYERIRRAKEKLLLSA
jgi:beta-N-acetylhexosaminidase